MKKLLFPVCILLALSAHSQGISVSYLFPQNGYLAAPVSPFSLRDVGFGDKFGINGGFTLYNIPGLAMEELPFQYDEPLVGPHFALLVPVKGFIDIPFDKVNINISAGGFGWWNINPRLMEGNMDRAFRAYKNWDVLNTDFDLDDKLGFGWTAGFEVQIALVSNVYLTLGGAYLSGAAKTEISGSYVGGIEGGEIQREQVAIDDAEINLEGIEISIGVQIRG